MMNYGRIAGALQGHGRMGMQRQQMMQRGGPRHPLSSMMPAAPGMGAQPPAEVPQSPAATPQGLAATPQTMPAPAPAVSGPAPMGGAVAPAPAPIQQPAPGPQQFNPMAMLQMLQSGNWLQGRKSFGQGGGMGSQMAGGQGQNPGGNGRAPGGWA